jgi:transcriptional regulator with XRE-family HTH domain
MELTNLTQLTQPPADELDPRIAPNNLRAIREDKGLSQAALNVVSGVGEPTMTKIELYDWVPGYDIRTKLARALDVTVPEIWPTLPLDNGTEL